MSPALSRPRRTHLARAVALWLSAALIAALLPVIVPTPASARTCSPKLEERDLPRVSGMRQARPRLLARGADLDRVAALSTTDAWASEARRRVRRAADRYAAAPVDPYAVLAGRLQFHGFKNRIVTLALAYRLEPDERYAQQAERELLAAARLRSWNPGHYLDTAEMTAATALGYDWFHDVLPPASRVTIAQAIVDKGLRTSLCMYRRGEGFVVRTDNWGVVVNSGMAMGAVAVADTHPRIAAAVLGGALRNVRPALGKFRGDGSYDEGTWYWRYATEHAVKLLATLDAAFGRDFGLGDIGGLRRTGNFLLRSTGPTGRLANFSNAQERIPAAPQLYWLARRYGRPIDAWQARRLSESTNSPLYLLWYSTRTRDPATADSPLLHVSNSIATAHFRGGWGPGAAYVAVKGGRNDASHAHRELGAFIFDVDGQRWATDLGADDYALPGYFDRTRNSEFYRLAARGQNTLRVGGRNQPHAARAHPVHRRLRARRAEVVYDLSPAYPAAASVRRGVALLGRRTLLVQDEVAAQRRQDVVWTMHTTADVTLAAGGRTAVLTQDGRRVRARIMRPTNGTATFRVESAYQAPPQAPNTGVSRLVIRTRTGPKATPESRSRLRLAVSLTPEGPSTPPAIRPLRDW
ncbi:MAG TPA: heparinase II/III family protein [Egibacteraceae bacterium]|nr:heparinase II/III family protein [Egibacteraceae bacterium]